MIQKIIVKIKGSSFFLNTVYLCLRITYLGVIPFSKPIGKWIRQRKRLSWCVVSSFSLYVD